MSSSTKNFEKLVQLKKEISILGTIRSQLMWDREVYIPMDSHGLRDQQDKLLSTLSQSQYMSNEFRSALEGALSENLNEIQSRQVELIRKEFVVATSASKEFLEKYVDSQNDCYAKFKEAKKEANFNIIQSSFENMVGLYKESTENIKNHPLMKDIYKDFSIYDVMIDSGFDPGLKNSNYEEYFLPLKNFLVSHLPEIQSQRPLSVNIKMPRDLQMKISREICELVGFNLKQGRIDETPIHPFCGGSVGDVRLTTRINEDDSIESIFSTLHEAGHGLYQQGLPQEYMLTPLGEAPSAAIHESQSRFIENQIGRSRPFVEYFSRASGLPYEELYKGIAGKKEGFLRTEADEIEYNLHVILRWEMEKEIVSGQMRVADIPEVWRERYKKYFGRTLNNDREGCLQDIHWYGIGFGYFPSYALGNMISAQLFSLFEKQNPHWELDVKNGKMIFIKDWLNKTVHCLGSKYDTLGTIKHIFGDKGLDPQVLISYLKTRYMK